MSTTAKMLRHIALAAVVMVGATAPLTVSAQSDLDTSEAQDFLGNWNLQVMSDAGGGAMTLSITDQGGKVAVEMGSPDLGGTQEVTDVTKQGEALRLAVQLDMQGQTFPIVMVLNTTDTGISADIDVADGMFVASGTGTRAD